MKKLSEKKRDEIIGSRVEDVLPDNIVETHLPLIKAAMNGEKALNFWKKHICRMVSSFYAGGKYVPIKSNDGEILGATRICKRCFQIRDCKN